MTGQDLKQLRESRRLSQKALGEFLDVSDASIHRWELGPDIPGPAQKLLNLFFNNIHPFSGQSTDRGASSSIAKLEFTLDEFQTLTRLANRRGFSDIKDYIVFAIRQHLADHRPATDAKNITPLYPESEKVAEDPVDYKTSK
jgi:transcriptional regulator with XRE-family HTH domain